VALTFIAIVLLAAAWAALLLPDLRRRGRGPSRRSDSIATFNRQLSTIDRARPGQRPSARVVAFPHRAGAPIHRNTRPGKTTAPRSNAQARQRRQTLLFALVALAVVTLAAGVLLTPMFLVLHLMVDAALGGFVWMLVTHRNRAMASRSRVARHDGYEATPLARRRAAGS
jgi:cytochrome c-type biogenesis protein CcmH/NrfG